MVGCKRIRAIETDAGHLALQVANADTTIGEHMAAIPRLDSRIDSMGECIGETQQNMGMLSDAVDGIHYGLVELGGFAQHRSLTLSQRRHMFTVEQANRVAMSALGHSQYMSTIRQQSRGYVHAGEDTN